MVDVLIVGAGPAGLSAAILLAQAGWSVRVLEQRPVDGAHSRAIGIHPPGLAVLDAVGIGRAAVRDGVRIGDGIGISRGRTIGRADFTRLPGRHNYILSLPQGQTLRLLRERLARLAPQALQRGIRYAGHEQLPWRPVVRITAHDVHSPDKLTTIQARWLIAADGTGSTVRDRLGLSFDGRSLDDRYVMGDYPDATGFGSTAALFLHHHGIVESFPLPGVLRRWVVHAGGHRAGNVVLEREVRERTGYRLDDAQRLMHSEFRTAHRQVASMVHGRVVLIGDAAHEISPIGGQGMTLGLLDAAGLSRLLLASTEPEEEPWREFSTRRLAAARRAGRQAHVNMILGRPLPRTVVPLRDGIFRVLAGRPRFMRVVTRTFSMNNHAGTG